MHDDNFEYYDPYEYERPYRWIGIVVWLAILFYLFALVAFGVTTTPIENGRPVLADTEMRQTRRYVDFMWQAIDQTQRIYADAHRVFSFFVNSSATDASSATDELMSLRLEAMKLSEQVARLSVPTRFSGLIVSIDNEEYINPKAFHPMFLETLAVEIEMLTEMYAYLTDFDPARLHKIDGLDQTLNELAEDSFGLFAVLVAN